MDLGTVLSVVQTLVAVLDSEELKEIFSFLGYKSQLQELQNTVSTVKAVLRDAETKELTEEAQDYIDGLKDAVYDADDLFDKFITLYNQGQLIKGGKITKKVRRFFSRHNPLGVAYSMSQEVKSIRSKLDALAKNRDQFGFKVDPQPIRLRREETCSYVYEDDIVGREDDIENVIEGHLLNESNHHQDVSFLSIVGIGGLGKTALAQLVYNDARVKSAFPLRIWTCVADHDQQQLDVAQILGKILAPSTGENYEGSNLEWLKTQVREKITSEKYLLVLDDVWTEDHHQWHKLAGFFKEVQNGSWIVVTTRSHETARIIGNGPKYELQGLSKENSWLLFEKIAFGPEQSTHHEDLVKIGQEIVEGCARVPLAIRVVGSLLYGQDKSKWLSFQETGLSNFKESQRGIMHLLKFSYHQLESPLKTCFTYCALFPKDYIIEKDDLISLWMAQGYIVPLDDGQTMEDLAEEYVSTLLRRCFFQDVKIKKFPDMGTSFKLHDLMHDIALDVARKEICVRNFASNINIDKTVRHVGNTSENLAKPLFTNNHIRSYCYVGERMARPQMDLSTLEALLSNWVCLRALDLKWANIISLPESIGGLLHLRYLDISRNYELEVLPKSTKKLYNLQTIKIRGCNSLKELPKDFIKSVNYNLRILKISKCGIEYLTCLGNLPNLKILELEFLGKLEYILASMEDGCLCFPSLERLKIFVCRALKGWRDSRVGVGDSGSSSSMTTLLFPQLKTLWIFNCKEMKCYLVCPKLEHMRLVNFNEGLQINEMRRKIGNEQWEASSSKATNFSSSSSYGFPKLRAVDITNVRWLNRMPMESFQHLVILVIILEKEMESLGEVGGILHSCLSSLKTLQIFGSGKSRRVMFGGLKYLTCLEKLKFVYCGDLSISEEEEEDQNEDGTGVTFPSLRSLSLKDIEDMRYLPKWIRFLTALETLKIQYCDRLEAMPEWMPQLTSLKELRIEGCSKKLDERCENPNREDWPLIQHIPSIHISFI